MAAICYRGWLCRGSKAGVLHQSLRGHRFSGHRLVGRNHTGHNRAGHNPAGYRLIGHRLVQDLLRARLVAGIAQGLASRPGGLIAVLTKTSKEALHIFALTGFPSRFGRAFFLEGRLLGGDLGALCDLCDLCARSRERLGRLNPSPNAVDRLAPHDPDAFDGVGARHDRGVVLRRQGLDPGLGRGSRRSRGGGGGGLGRSRRRRGALGGSGRGGSEWC